MSISDHLVQDLSLPYAGVERRAGPRISVPFPATVRGVDAEGARFRVGTLLDNLGQGGLHVHLPHRVDRGAALRVMFWLSTSLTESAGPRVVVRGVVLRANRRPNGLWGVAMAITNHRFL